MITKISPTNKNNITRSTTVSFNFNQLYGMFYIERDGVCERERDRDRKKEREIERHTRNINVQYSFLLS